MAAGSYIDTAENGWKRREAAGDSVGVCLATEELGTRVTARVQDLAADGGGAAAAARRLGRRVVLKRSDG